MTVTPRRRGRVSIKRRIREDGEFFEITTYMEGVPPDTMEASGSPGTLIPPGSFAVVQDHRRRAQVVMQPVKALNARCIGYAPKHKALYVVQHNDVMTIWTNVSANLFVGLFQAKCIDEALCRILRAHPHVTTE